MIFKKISIIPVLLLLAQSPFFAQDCSELFIITEGQAVNAGGVGTTFNGKVADDDNLYFIGSTNGLRKSLWKTDGTAIGTSKVIEDESSFGSNWDNYHLIEEGFLIQDNDNWSLITTGNNEIISLIEFEEVDFEWISESSDGTYYLAGETDSGILAIEFDPNTLITNQLGHVHPNTSKMNIYAGDHGVLFYAKNSSLDSETAVLIKATGELLKIGEYLATLGYAVDDYNGGYIHGKYMYASFRNDQNQFDHIIVDMASGEATPVDGTIQGTIQSIEHDNNIYFKGSNKVIKLDTENFVTTSVFNDIFPFSPMTIFNNQLILVGENSSNNTFQIASIDMSTDEINYLPQADIGAGFLNSKFLEYNNDFYYIATDNQENFLYKYDFVNEEPILINVLSEVTGATVVHALEKVQDRLVSSIRFDLLQHELAFCSGTIDGIIEPKFTELSVFPSPSSDYLIIDGLDKTGTQNDIKIFNAVGEMMIIRTTDTHGKMNVSDLVAGLYYGSFTMDEESFVFRFVKE